MYIFRIAFTVAVCDSDCLTSNGSRILTNELESWGEDVGVVVCFKILRGYLSSVIEGRQGTTQNSVPTKRWIGLTSSANFLGDLSSFPLKETLMLKLMF